MSRRAMMAAAAVGGGGGAPSLPYSTGVKLWLPINYGLYTDAGVTPVASNGDNVKQWNDLSGSAFHATNNTGVNIPTYCTTDQDRSKNTVAFAGNGSLDFNKLLLPSGLNTALNAAGAAHFFIRFRNLTGNTAKQHGACWFGGTSGSGANWTWNDGNVYETAFQTGQTNCGAPGFDFSSAYFVYQVVAATNRYRVKAATTTLVNSSSAFTPTFNTSAQWYLGGGNPLVGLVYGMDANIAEVIIFDHELSGTDESTIYTYLTT